MTDPVTVRDEFVAYVRRQLVGPFGAADEIIFDPPNRRYLMGILFPRSMDFADYVEAEGEQEDAAGAAEGGDEGAFSDDPVSAANDYLPSSQGLSFFTDASTLTVVVRAAEYETLSGQAAKDALAANPASHASGPTEDSDEDPRGKKKGVGRIWRRSALPEVTVSITAENRAPVKIWDGKAEVHVRWRVYPRGALVTVTVVNARSADDEHPERHWDEMLLQTELAVRAADGRVLEYPAVSLASHDEEEQELRLIHRRAKVFAIGHGCAPEWDAGSVAVTEVRSEVMPAFKVPSMNAGGTDARARDLAWLAAESTSTEDLAKEMAAFIEPYAAWLDTLKATAANLDGHHADAAARIIARVERARDRMRDGASVFVSHPERALIARAFRLANEAMLMQIRHSAKDLVGTRHPRSDAPSLPTEYPAGAKWHPFQVGFFLTVLRGLVDESHEDRDVVDLIWFPTGGGKTEAYLLVAAFEIFRRRLLYGAAGGGTTVISRYTLSLLTAQQFQRTASTICACEHIRRKDDSGDLGDEPISVGLWVGSATTPNQFKQAVEKFDELRDGDETDDRFLLERCPWCGTEIVPRKHSGDDADYGIRATDTSFNFRCTSPHCEFGDVLPVRVIDEDLYQRPPSFLLGTVDKFAQLAWVAASGALFGRGHAKRPPSLIVQDELHLLTGPLGTTVGLYETAINLLCEHDGRPPKVIASTATIRRASEQIAGLFGRQVDLFPPSGLDADNSYYATADHTRPGRLYIGLMAQGHTSDTAVVQTGAALLQAPVDLRLTGAAQDAYWTVVAYHSSLRELGRTVTIANDDINARLDALIVGRSRRVYDVDELSSSVPRALQPRLLERLNLTCEKSNSVDFLATTNMLSVGVDVPRLGLMLMNGQPKATAEYIQATSRVGRSHAPGLVFGLFRATKPRDRSHYENFRAYHSALYRHVEPTSVTPFSPPSRDRALHAALVILVRHRLGLAEDGRAGYIVDQLPAVRALATSLVAVVERVEPRERTGAQAYLDGFIDDWVDRAGQASRQNKALYYTPQGKGHLNLIRNYNQRASGWPTLQSMRNVDFESLVDVQRGGGGARS